MEGGTIARDVARFEPGALPPRVRGLVQQPVHPGGVCFRTCAEELVEPRARLFGSFATDLLGSILLEPDHRPRRDPMSLQNTGARGPVISRCR